MATVNQSLDRGLPAAIEAEKSILGAVLLDNAVYDQTTGLKSEDFYLDGHRRIFGAMIDLRETSRAIDIITLTDELGRRKDLEASGGVAYIASLTDGVPRRPSIEQYVKIVRDKAMLRALIHACNNTMSQAIDQSDTVEEILDRAEAEVFAISQGRVGNDFKDVASIVKDSFGSVDALLKRGQRITGMETHFSDLDGLTSGFQPSDLIIIAARPSMGKTAFAMNIAENAAVQDGKVVGIFSLEMSREALLLRMLCSQSQVNSHNMRTGFLGREDIGKLQAGLERLLRAPLYIDDTPGISVSEMRAKARRLAQMRQGQLDLIVVDYLQLMSGTPIGGKRFENRTQEVSAISRGLKAVAKELRVPVVALSQLSRAPEQRGGKDNEPKLSDLRESGSIEQDADVVMFLYRPEYYDRDNVDLEGIAKLIIGKQRNGPTDTVQLAFQKEFTKFMDLDRSSWIKG